MRLTFIFGDGKRKKQLSCAPTIWDGNGNYPKSSCYLGQEWELPKSFPNIWDGSGKTKKLFPLFGNWNSRRSRWEIYGNGNSRSCLPHGDPYSKTEDPTSQGTSQVGYFQAGPAQERSAATSQAELGAEGLTQQEAKTTPEPEQQNNPGEEVGTGEPQQQPKDPKQGGGKTGTQNPTPHKGVATMAGSV